MLVEPGAQAWPEEGLVVVVAARQPSESWPALAPRLERGLGPGSEPD